MKEKEKEEKKVTKISTLSRNIGLVLNGKFFPRKFFARNWGLLLTFVALFLSSIAHRNMYMVQINKIKKLEVELIDMRTNRLMMEYKRDENMRLHEITEAIERYDLPLIHSPEPKEIIEITPNTERENGRE